MSKIVPFSWASCCAYSRTSSDGAGVFDDDAVDDEEDAVGGGRISVIVLGG